MTDYLEELLDHAGELLEQVRRLERGGRIQRESDADHAPLSPAPASQGLTPVSAGWEGSSLSQWGETPAEDSEHRPESGISPASGAPGEKLDSPSGGGYSFGREVASSPSPLLEQLVSLERAAGYSGRVEASKVSSPSREGGGYPLSLAKPGGWTPDPAGPEGSGWSGALPRSAPPPGGALSWAEEADRAFRRDSRRYDGGFYLY